ncbi:MAG UNVERIFIED_CONTAM: hypothetical protein LVR18_50680 [Planctomycetaceae bacterium]
MRLLQFLENVAGGGDIPVEDAVERMLRFHRGRGVAILASDFLTLGDLSRPMNMLYSAGLEVWGLQILSDAEIAPNVEGDLRFVDSETGYTLDITNAGELLSIYHDQRLRLQATLDNMCRRRQGRFLSVSSAVPFNDLLFDGLCRQGWVQR